MPVTINGYYPDTVSENWTKTSIQCYYNGLMCNKCDLPEDIKKDCKMKGVVLDLVRKYGKPHRRKD